MHRIQAELREFIRRLTLGERRGLSIDQRIAALEESMRDFVADGRGGGGVSLTTLKGKIIGGLGTTTATYVPMPDTTLRVVGHVSGTDYGTYLVPTGQYEIMLANVNPADTSMDFYAFGPVSPRFTGASPLAYNRPVLRGGTNNVQEALPPAAPGYGYLLQSFVGPSGACQYPVGTMNWVDPALSSGTVSWAGGPHGIDALGRWNGPPSDCFLANSIAFGPCPARSGVPVEISLAAFTGGLIPYVRYRNTLGSGACPNTGTCPVSSGPSNDGALALTNVPLSKSCPGPDLSVKFDATWPCNSIFHGGTPSTIRFYEP